MINLMIHAPARGRRQRPEEIKEYPQGGSIYGFNIGVLAFSVLHIHEGRTSSLPSVVGMAFYCSVLPQNVPATRVGRAFGRSGVLPVLLPMRTERRSNVRSPPPFSPPTAYSDAASNPPVAGLGHTKLSTLIIGGRYVPNKLSRSVYGRPHKADRR